MRTLIIGSGPIGSYLAARLQAAGADVCGVIAIPPKDFEKTVARARQRVAKEASIIAALKKGEHLYDLSGADAVFRTLGIDERDTDWQSEGQHRSPPR